MVSQGVLLVIGNPLLDISASVDLPYLEKYELKPGNAILAEPKQLPIYDDLINNHKVDYISGGAAQNSSRVAQWLIGVHGATGYIGCIGKDANGVTIRKATEDAGVKTHYLVDDTQPTGTCAVLLTDRERSLCTNLGAANCYKRSHLESEEIQKVVENAQFYYSTGYFLTVSPDSLVAIGKHAAANNKPLLFNLAAPFVIQFFWDQMASVLPYVDIVFSNEDEAKTLGTKLGWGDNLAEIANKLAGWEKENKKRNRMVVFTQGAKATVVYHQGHVQEYHPIPVKKEEIVDLNGAGDSFVGGFLAGYSQGKSIDACIDAAHYCACEVIKRSGCTLPAKPSFSFN